LRDTKPAWLFHEGTQTVEAMKEVVSRSLQDLVEIGGQVASSAGDVAKYSEQFVLDSLGP
jgi:hypothetical protein